MDERDLLDRLRLMDAAVNIKCAHCGNIANHFCRCCAKWICLNPICNIKSALDCYQITIGDWIKGLFK